MDEAFPSVDPIKCLKTYGKVDRPPLKLSELYTPAVLELPTLPKTLPERKQLTTKNAVELLLGENLRSKVCRYCLNITSELSHLDQILQVAGKGTLYKVAIKDMIASFHPFKVVNDPNFPNKICENCLDRAISCYLFVQQCDQAERALQNCFEDIYEKTNKLDPLERNKKRGRHKLHPNYNIINTVHEKVIDYADPIINIVNTSSEKFTAQDPISELECLKCCEILPNLNSLINHTKKHPTSMWYNCRLCGTSFAKRHHINKHFKLKHSAHSQKKEKKVIFECRRCGTVFDKCSEYLQHLEKHKFKSVMEHLVERKMDKLCAVCFNKGSEMTELDKTICLHGICPELSGDRSLYAILESTLPVKKNKYRELLLPTQASIMRFFKKKKEHGASNFSLSNPIVLSVYKSDCNKQIIYSFSEPLCIDHFDINDNNDNTMNVSQVVEIGDQDQPDINDNNIKVSQVVEIGDQNQPYKSNVQNNMFDSEIDCSRSAVGSSSFTIDKNTVKAILDQSKHLEVKDQPETQKITNFSFSNPDSIIIDEDTKIVCGETETSKEICEISTYAKVTISKDILNDVGPNASPCKYCWVFIHLAKCNHCGKLNDTLSIDLQLNNLVSEPQKKSDYLSSLNENSQKDGNTDTNSNNIDRSQDGKIDANSNALKDKQVEYVTEPLLNTEENIFKVIQINDLVKSYILIEKKEEINLPTFYLPNLLVNQISNNDKVNISEEVFSMDTDNSDNRLDDWFFFLLS